MMDWKGLDNFFTATFRPNFTSYAELEDIWESVKTDGTLILKHKKVSDQANNNCHIKT